MIQDQKTLRLLADRDPEFLDTLFREINPFLVRVCLANGFFYENADEVIHETWEKFFTNVKKFEGRSQIRTFICGILYNKIRERRRTDSKTIYEDDCEKIMNQSSTAEGWWKVVPTDPERLAELTQASRVIRKCFDGLSEIQKLAFL